MKTYKIELHTTYKGQRGILTFTREAASAAEAIKASIDMNPGGPTPISMISCTEEK